MKEKNGEMPPALPSASAPKQYTLTEAERRHVAEISANLNAFQDELLKLKGAILDKQNEMDLMRRHLRMTFGLWAQEHGLPMGARLSPDGTRLVASEG